MKAIPSALMIVAITLSTLSCVGQEPSGKEGRLSAGAHPVDGRYLQELSVEWEYYPGLFLVTGDDFESQDAVARRTYVNFRDNDQRKEAWKKFAPYEGFDYGTYRLVVEFADTRPKDLLMRVPFFDMAVELFVQGQTRFTNGVVGTSGETSRPLLYHPVIIEASSVTGRLDLVLHVANHHFPLWGTQDYLVIGDADSLNRYVIRQTYVEAMLVGSLVIMVMANLILVLLTQDRQSPLYLLFLSLAAILLNLSNGSAVLGLLGLEWEVMNRLIYFAISLEFLFMGIYLFHQIVADRKKSSLAKLVFGAASMPFFIIIALAPVAIFSLSYYIHAILTISVMAWALLTAAWRGMKGDPRYAFIALTILLLLLFFWVDSEQVLRINGYSYASPYSVALFSLLNIGMLAWRVRSFNAELEHQVKERTRELVQEREQVEAKVRDAVLEIREKDDLLGLQSRQAATGEMIDFIAHQWKQSLYAISLHSELLRSRIRQDGTVGMDFAKKPLDSIQMVMDEMVRGMDVLRNFASPTRQPERFSLAGAVEETMALLRDRFSVKRVGLKLETAADAVVYGSPQELKQVLMNLLINAQEAVSREVGRRGTVSVHIRPEAPADASPGADTYTLLEVEDDGGGIPPELAGTLFDKFTTSKPSGSGLGLYLSRMIVERHFGGSISARNEGEGAVFTVRLPTAGQASVSIVTTVPASIPASVGGA